MIYYVNSPYIWFISWFLLSIIFKDITKNWIWWHKLLSHLLKSNSSSLMTLQIFSNRRGRCFTSIVSFIEEFGGWWLLRLEVVNTYIWFPFCVTIFSINHDWWYCWFILVCVIFSLYLHAFGLPIWHNINRFKHALHYCL